MVLCVHCVHLTRRTRECSAYLDSKDNPVVIKPREIHRQMSCARYVAKWKKVLEVKMNG